MAKDMKGKMKDQMMAIGSMMNKPRLQLDSKMLPEIKDWKIGEKYEIILEVKQESMRKSMDSDAIEASFEILSAKTEDEAD